jgi:hypothetical protein
MMSFSFLSAHMKKLGRIALVCMIISLVSITNISPSKLFDARPAYAHTCTNCGCSNSQSAQTRQHITNEHIFTNFFILDQFRYHQNWFFGANGISISFFHTHVLAALKMMTEQLVSVGMAQMAILGGFYDADVQIDTQRLFQKQTAQAHKDYHPSFQMCVFGTNARSLSASGRNGSFAGFAMAQKSIDRQLGMGAVAAAYSMEVEKKNRLEQFKTRYCDPRDNNNGFGELCGAGAGGQTVNKDIDYTRTVELMSTLEVDFSDSNLTNDEQDIIALSNNLFSSDVMDGLSNAILDREQAANPFLEFRSLVAKRNVAESSFNAVIGLKAAGSADSQETLEYSRHILGQLGVVDRAEQERLIAGQSPTGAPLRRPSYYAQMELMAQKIYQSPDFFTNLYDKPVNVTRKDVAMQAIGLMLNRDMFQSELRSEMVMSVILEDAIFAYQRDIQNRLNPLTEAGEEN